MKLTVLPFLCCGTGAFIVAGQEPIAFLKGGEGVYVTNADGLNARRLDHDQRAKSELRWDGHRSRVSYFVAGEQGAHSKKTVLVELDKTGDVVMEVPIPDDENMRFIEDFEWLPNGKARLGGSMNPRNCISEDFDPDTRSMTNWQAGKCGSFVRSPDEKHTAEIGVMNMTDDDHSFDDVDIDSHMHASLTSLSLYRGGGHHVFVPAGPIWSLDSQSVVFIEKRADTGEAAVIFLTLAKVATRVPVPAFVLDNPAIAWVGSKVVAGGGDKAIQIDPVTKQISAVTSDISDEIARRINAKRAAEAARARVDDLVKRMGGREGIVLETAGAK